MALYCRIKGVENSLMGAFNFSNHYSFGCQLSAISFPLSAFHLPMALPSLPIAVCLLLTAYRLWLLHSPPMD
jgi:hypothetical protein